VLDIVESDGDDNTPMVMGRPAAQNGHMDVIGLACVFGLTPSP
jgi:hypothetical protein